MEETKKKIQALGKEINEDMEGENPNSIIIQLLQKIEENTRKF